MRTVEELVKRVRRETRNATTGSTTAGASIKDIEFIDALNDGQELCVELITGLFSNYFQRTKVYTIDTSVTDYEILTIPSYLLLGTRIVLVEYSYSGNADNYVPIQPLDIRERYTGNSYQNTLTGYTLSGSQIILSEKPKNNSKVRVIYEITPPRLDVAKVTLLTGSRSGTDFSGTFTTPTTVDTDGDGTTDVAGWANGDLVTVIDTSDNSVLIQDGSFSAFSYGGGTFTIDLTDATYTAATVDAATATNLIMIEGGRTNVPEIPANCERFITHYANWSIFERDASKLARGARQRFETTKESLQQSYLTATKDWPAVPEVDY